VLTFNFWTFSAKLFITSQNVRVFRFWGSAVVQITVFWALKIEAARSITFMAS
jgi:hypothetical protein